MNTEKWLSRKNISYRINPDGLIYVDGNIIIEKNNNVTLDALTEVAGSVCVEKGADVSFPALAEVTCDVYVWKGANVSFPALVTIGHVAYETEIFGHEIKLFDRIGCKVLSKKIKDGNTIRYCQRSKFKDKKLIGDKFYIASSRSNHAHANTVGEAIQDLHFKSGNHDVIGCNCTTISNRGRNPTRRII